jgi:hypothetical protein
MPTVKAMCSNALNVTREANGVRNQQNAWGLTDESLVSAGYGTQFVRAVEH